MPKYLVPAKLRPGIQRRGRLFKAGVIADFDKADVHLKLVPIEPSAYALLVEKFGADKVKAEHGDGPKAPPAPPPPDQGQTLRQLEAATVASSMPTSKAKTDSKGKGRASDS
jgi:hypothetical protein